MKHSLLWASVILVLAAITWLTFRVILAILTRD